MGTLLLRLAGPLQAWGQDSKFNIRQTAYEPSKSGVIGLLAAALGRRREEPLDDLAALRFGVRVMRQGQLLVDYHTVSRDPKPRPSENKTDYVTKRYYLSDALFVAGLEGEDEAFLRRLSDALWHPAFPLFLGRRSCPPVLPLCLGIQPLPLREALMQAEVPDQKRSRETWSGRLVIEAPPADRDAALVRDQPVSFSHLKREFAYRKAWEEFIRPGEKHDAFGELEG